MNTYKITIKETLIREVEVKANDYHDAIEKVIDKYNSEEVVLNYNDFNDVDIY